MSMATEFDSHLKSRSLEELDALIWRILADAVSSPDHPWNLAAFSTVSSTSTPACRTVVLREANSAARTIACYTDVRSQKVDDLHSQKRPHAAWMFYDRDSKIQLRIEGETQVISGAEADQAWNDTSVESRAAYLSIATPGLVTEERSPPDTGDRIVSRDQSERGRQNFRIVRSDVRHIDWLYLKRDGHMRATINYLDGQPVARWLVP